MGSGSVAGGIAWLRDKFDGAEPFIVADFRTIYGISAYDIGITISYREAISLVGMLRQNPASWLHANEQGWTYPVSSEWIVLKHLFDITARANSEKTPPEYPAPWIRSTKPKQTERSEVERRLRLMNPERQ